MAKRGPKPSLIGGTFGTPKLVSAINRRTCKRCDASIDGGQTCVELPLAGKMGHRTFCVGCFGEVLDQTQVSLDRLRTEITTPRS